MNETIKHQLNHRTIRFHKDKRVEQDIMDQVLEVFQRTASSVCMQYVSLVHVTDPEKKKRIAEVGNQPYIANEPELFIFVIDCYRNYRIAEEKGYTGPGPSMNMFFQGQADALLAAQNMVNAIESFGLGANYLGNVLNDPEEMIAILDLPKYTFPILGLGFGYPDDNPELKPRMDVSLRVSENSYQVYDNYLEEIADYDKAMTTYYDTRQKNQRSDSFSNQVLGQFENRNEKRDRVLHSVAKQGFDLKVDGLESREK